MNGIVTRSPSAHALLAPAGRRSFCSCTSQDCALRSACRIAWTAIGGAPGRRAWLLPGRSQEPLVFMAVQQPERFSRKFAGITYCYHRCKGIRDTANSSGLSFLRPAHGVARKFARLKAQPFGLLAFRFAALQSALTRKFCQQFVFSGRWAL